VHSSLLMIAHFQKVFLADPQFDKQCLGPFFWAKKRGVRLAGCLGAPLTNAVYVETLPCSDEFCCGSSPRDHLSCCRIFQIYDVAASQANQVYVRLRIGIESCLALQEIQFLDETEFSENLEGLVNCRKADCRVKLPDCAVYPLRSWMIATMKCKSTNRYPLWSGFVPPLAESFDYPFVRFFSGVHTFY
jgi:hypothetical protein